MTPAIIELIKRAAAVDDKYQLLRQQFAIGWAELPAEFTTFADESVECDDLVFTGQRVVARERVVCRDSTTYRLHSSHTLDTVRPAIVKQRSFTPE